MDAGFDFDKKADRVDVTVEDKPAGDYGGCHICKERVERRTHFDIVQHDTRRAALILCNVCTRAMLKALGRAHGGMKKLLKG